MKVYEGKNEAYKLLKDGKSFFLTGKAGTGKSTFLKSIINDDVDNSIIVLAPTGIAALNVGGQTIHSFFRLPLRIIMSNDKDIIRFRENSATAKVIEKMKTLIIDEVSMVRPDILDCIDQSLKKNKRNQKPFGGVQIILVGDLFQIPPISKRDEFYEYEHKRIYSSNFFYSAHSFNNRYFSIVQFTDVYRQKDIFFSNLLDNLRHNNEVAMLIEEFNKFFSIKEKKYINNDIVLAPRNKTVDRINQSHLDELDAELYSYIAEIEGKFAESKYPTKEVLELKKGAQIMFIRNDKEGKWVNGTIGKVVDINEKKVITVEKENKSLVEVERVTWENCQYSYNADKERVDKEILGTFTQIPLKLAWAITIHKSQGLTLNNITLNLEGGTFVAGQCYVALSRLRSIKGLRLQRPLRPSDIKTNSEVISFYLRHGLQ